MGKNRVFVKKEDLIQQPIIYIRIKNNKVMYVGESKSILTNRHTREDDGIGDFDTIICLKASLNVRRRKYWEAYLIVKLKPENQTAIRYRSFLHKVNTGSSLNIVEYKKSILVKDIKNMEELDNLRKKTNVKGVIYWSDQINLAKKRLKESQDTFLHFVKMYKKDKTEITSKNGQI